MTAPPERVEHSCTPSDGAATEFDRPAGRVKGSDFWFVTPVAVAVELVM